MYRVGKMKIRKITLYDVVTAAAILVGILALIALLYFNVRPIKFADIKVPVATDKSSYYAGQQIGGIFFGETFYDGNVKILREVFCTNYKGIIAPPENAKDGNFFDTIAKPRKFEGNTITIGVLPADVPIGSNCVIRFTNVYNIQTPFGVRHEEYQYYTQNFSIISKERRQQLDCEATGKSTQECQDALSDSADGNKITSTDNTFGGVSSSGGNSSDGKTQINNSTTNNTTNNTTTTPPPVNVHEECTINFIVKFGCRQVAD